MGVMHTYARTRSVNPHKAIKIKNGMVPSKSSPPILITGDVLSVRLSPTFSFSDECLVRLAVFNF